MRQQIDRKRLTYYPIRIGSEVKDLNLVRVPNSQYWQDQFGRLHTKGTLLINEANKHQLKVMAQPYIERYRAEELRQLLEKDAKRAKAQKKLKPRSKFEYIVSLKGLTSLMRPMGIRVVSVPDVDKVVVAIESEKAKAVWERLTKGDMQ